MRMHLVIRFDYGLIVPWVQRCEDGITAIAGPDLLVLAYPVELAWQEFHDPRRLRRRGGRAGALRVELVAVTFSGARCDLTPSR